MSGVAVDRIERLAPGQRWLADERRVAHGVGGLAERVVDMTHAAAWIEAQTAAGKTWALALLVVRAAALAIARRPEHGKLVAGYKVLTPGTVDIGLSASGLTEDVPLLLPSADRRPLAALASLVDQAGGSGRARSAVPGRWSWLAPLGWLRRLLLAWLRRSPRWLRGRAGTFHVTFAAGVDLVAPLRFHTGSALGAARVRELVAAVDGRIVTRKVMSLTLVVDHVAMDGVRAAALLNEIAGILESHELAAEML